MQKKYKISFQECLFEAEIAQFLKKQYEYKFRMLYIQKYWDISGFNFEIRKLLTLIE